MSRLIGRKLLIAVLHQEKTERDYRLSIGKSDRLLEEQIAATPVLLGVFFILHGVGTKLNAKMAGWSKKSGAMSVFSITNGDQDAVTKMAARAKNSALKLVGSGVLAFFINLAAGVACWWLIGA